MTPTEARYALAESIITYPPEMLPSPDEGQEAEVWVVTDDGTMVRVWPPSTPPSNQEGGRDDA